MISKILSNLLRPMLYSRLFFAQQDCVLCGAGGGTALVCDACRRDLPSAPAPACPTCAAPSDGHVCGACLQDPPAFARTIAALRYAFPADELIHALKYRDQLPLAPLFADLLLHAVKRAPRPDVLVPMPLHPQRARERGFNQVLEIAKPLAHALDIPIDFGLLSRSRNTTPQVALPLAQRHVNMRGAFTCPQPIGGKHVALLDDVMTSGATLNEAARTLRRAGATEISVWVVARALPHH
jgi:ComF family protein